jgi:transaldolase
MRSRLAISGENYEFAIDTLGIDLAAIANELEAEGIDKFIQPYNSLLNDLGRLQVVGG